MKNSRQFVKKCFSNCKSYDSFTGETDIGIRSSFRMRGSIGSYIPPILPDISFEQ